MCQIKNGWLPICLVAVLFLGISFPAFSSSVIPPKNFGELVRISDLVIVAKAGGATGFKRGELIMTGTSFTILDVVKGSAVIGSSINVETFGGTFGDMGYSIGGSPQFVEGDVYLLSLSEFNGNLTFRFMSYGVMVQRRMVTGNQVFTHLENAHELNLVVPDGREIEPITTYVSSTVVSHLKQVAAGSTSWSSDDAGEVAYAGHNGSLQMDSITGLDAAPPGCVYMNNPGTPVRWRRFEQSLSVNVKVINGAPANVVTAVQNSIAAWKAVPGIDMGTLAYAGNNPPQGSCNAFSNANFNTISDGDSHIYLNDPCGEIPDLTACSGTLAIAGPAFFNTPHLRNGENWLEAIRGIMIVNNDTPACLTAAEYEQTITHELGHILGFGHHTGGTANMNANCCSPITSLDETCAVYSYGTGAVNPLPVITSLSPNNANQGTNNLVVQFNGTNFVTGGTISTFGPGITFNSASFVNSTQMTVNINIAPDATPGARNVTYTNPGPGGGLSNAVTFTVNGANNPVPTLTSVAPNSGAQGVAVPVTLTGTNFVASSTVSVSGTGVTVSNVSVTNATTITALFTINGGAALGGRNVTVTNPAPGGGTSGSQVFTVTAAGNPAPLLTSLVPNSADRGTSNLNVTINGNNLNVAGAEIDFSGTGITINSAQILNNTTATMNISIASDAPLGGRTFTWTTPAPGGGQSSLTFTVTEPANPVPTLTTVAPNTGAQGTAIPVTLTGTNFVAGSTVQVSGAGITVSDVSVTDATTITALLTISGGATLGARNVSVTNPAPGGGTSNSAVFTVTQALNPVPVITSLNPNSANQGASNVVVQILGSNFVSGGTLGIGGTGITINSASFINSTQLSMNLTIAPDAPLGPRNLSIINPGPGGGESNEIVFTITQAQNLVPLLTSVAPSSGVQGSAVPITLTGQNFVSGSTVSVSGSGISVSNVTFTNPTTLTALFTISGGAAPGARSVTVTNPAPGGGISAAQTFTVTELFVNKQPTMNVIGDVSFLHTAPDQVVNLSGISAGPGENQNLTVTAVAANSQLIQTLSVQYVSPQSTGTLRFQNDRRMVGTTTITVKVKDNGGTANGGVDSLMRVFTVNVNLDTDLETEDPDLPTDYDLLQNYPNPFNPSTIIPFNLPGRAFVTIGVYDVTGRLRTTLLHQEMGAGRHELPLDASSFGSGLYLVRMTSEYGIKSRMIMLVK